MRIKYLEVLLQAPHPDTVIYMYVNGVFPDRPDSSVGRALGF